MTPQEQEILDALPADGSVTTYRELYNAVAPENRLPLRKNLKRLKAAGLLAESNLRTEEGETLHHVRKVV